MSDPSSPVYVRVAGEAVFRVTDPAAVFAAAKLRVSSRDYGDDEAGLLERESELGFVGEGIANALLEVADSDRMVSIEAGVESCWGTTSADLCDERGQVLQQLDLGALFDACQCGQPDCERCNGFQMTARNAALLHTAAKVLADDAYDDVEEHGDDPVNGNDWAIFAVYPRITFKQNAVWRRQAARCFDDLASDIESGLLPIPRCIGEEMALRLMLGWAREMTADEAELLAHAVLEDPAHPDDYDWDMLFDCLFQDDDLAALFNPEEDGIEDPSAETNQALGMGDYRPHVWFKWFLNVEPRDGRRPFRR